MQLGKLAAAISAALMVSSVGAGTVAFTSAARQVLATGSGDAGLGCATVTSQQSNPLFGPWQIGVVPPAFATGSATQVSTILADSLVFGSGEVTLQSTPVCEQPSIVDSHIAVQFTVVGSVVAVIDGALEASEDGAGSAAASVCVRPVGGRCAYERSVASGATGRMSAIFADQLELAAGVYEIVILATAFTDQPGVLNACAASFDLSATFFPVANDDCADAEPIDVDLFSLFDTSFATDDGPPQETCLASVGEISIVNDVWFRYESVCDASLVISLCGISDFDTVLAVYDGCPDTGGVLLGCNDDAPNCPGFTSQLIVPAFAGRSYLIRVGGAADSAAGSSGFGGILMTCEVPNDYCIDSLPVGNGSTPFSTVGATTDGPAPRGACGDVAQIDDDIWFRYVAPCSGEAHVSACGDFDTRLAVYAGACPEDSTTLLACSDASRACDAGAQVNFEVSAGATYRIRVGGGVGRPGHGTLELAVECSGCLGDLVGDGVVDGADLGVLLGAWGASGSPADVNGDNFVDGSDLGIMLGAWGVCP